MEFVIKVDPVGRLLSVFRSWPPPARSLAMTSRSKTLSKSSSVQLPSGFSLLTTRRTSDGSLLRSTGESRLP